MFSFEGVLKEVKRDKRQGVDKLVIVRGDERVTLEVELPVGLFNLKANAQCKVSVKSERPSEKRKDRITLRGLLFKVDREEGGFERVKFSCGGLWAILRGKELGVNWRKGGVYYISIEGVLAT